MGHYCMSYCCNKNHFSSLSLVLTPVLLFYSSVLQSTSLNRKISSKNLTFYNKFAPRGEHVRCKSIRQCTYAVFTFLISQKMSFIHSSILIFRLFLFCFSNRRARVWVSSLRSSQKYHQGRLSAWQCGGQLLQGTLSVQDRCHSGGTNMQAHMYKLVSALDLQYFYYSDRQKRMLFGHLTNITNMNSNSHRRFKKNWQVIWRQLCSEINSRDTSGFGFLNIQFNVKSPAQHDKGHVLQQCR